MRVGPPLLCALVALAAACSSAPDPAVDAVAAAEARLGIELDETWVETNGVRLHVVSAGPPAGPPVVLLHGIPEFWYGWHRQIGALAEAGFRVIVPDQRGYNTSQKPAGIEAYRGSEGVKDVVGLIDALGHERVHLAGHDAGRGWRGAWRSSIPSASSGSRCSASAIPRRAARCARRAPRRSGRASSTAPSAAAAQRRRGAARAARRLGPAGADPAALKRRRRVSRRGAAVLPAGVGAGRTPSTSS